MAKESPKEIVEKEAKYDETNSAMFLRLFIISDVNLRIDFKGRGEPTVFKDFKMEQKIVLNIVGCMSLNNCEFELHSRLISNCAIENLSTKLIEVWFPTASSKIKHVFSLAKGNLFIKRAVNLELLQGLSDVLIGFDNAISYVENIGTGKKFYQTQSMRAHLPNGVADGFLQGLNSFAESVTNIFNDMVAKSSEKYKEEGLLSAATTAVKTTALGVVTKPTRGMIKIGANILNGIATQIDPTLIERAKSKYKLDSDDKSQDLAHFVNFPLDGEEEIKNNKEKEEKDDGKGKEDF